MSDPGDPQAEAARIVQQSGHAVVCLPDPQGNHLAYTVGLSDRPDRDHGLAVTGQLPQTAGAVLNSAVDALILNGLDPAEDLVVSVLNRLPVRFRRVSDTRRFAATRRSGRVPAVWQVLLPDQGGVYPGDPSNRIAFIQPLL
ncbi:DUF4262 domain-containing protein [Streptomyces sp. NPDC051644]|uniref:DUF4262 domain-containing protein n=1 Tax=Streptomyces sp. NPDC051644 TaxID=3365666 RepID=UPI0037ADCC88